MPIYEYVCRDCGHELEALQRLSDAPLTDCPSCEAAALQKKVSAAGFRLKGAGWYETDFKSSGKRNLAGDSAKSGGDSDAKSADKAPAAKTDSAGGSASAGSASKSSDSSSSSSQSSGPKSSGTQSSGSSTASA